MPHPIDNSLPQGYRPWRFDADKRFPLRGIELPALRCSYAIVDEQEVPHIYYGDADIRQPEQKYFIGVPREPGSHELIVEWPIEPFALVEQPERAFVHLKDVVENYELSPTQAIAMVRALVSVHSWAMEKAQQSGLLGREQGQQSSRRFNEECVEVAKAFAKGPMDRGFDACDHAASEIVAHPGDHVVGDSICHERLDLSGKRHL